MTSTKCLNKSSLLSSSSSSSSPTQMNSPTSTQSPTTSARSMLLYSTSSPTTSCQSLSTQSLYTKIAHLDPLQNELQPSPSLNDLNEIVYAVALMIVEGRHVNSDSNESWDVDTQRGLIKKAVKYYVKEGEHASFMTKSLLNKINQLNSQSMAVESQKMLMDQCDEFIEDEHICNSDLKCQIASKLKISIEKCMRAHSELEIVYLTNLNQQQQQKQKEQQEQQQNLNLKNANLQLKKFPIGYLESNNYSSYNSKDNDFSFLTNFESATNSTTTTTTTNDQQIEDSISINTNITIDVYLLADCCYDEFVKLFGQNLITRAAFDEQIRTNSNFNFELLERWSINMLTNKKISENTNEGNQRSLINLNELFLAIRSYLHFSQISSWINHSKGEQPKNIAFSLSYSNEKKYNKNEELDSALVKNTANNLTKQEYQTVLKESTTTTTTVNENGLLKEFDQHSFPSINLALLDNKLFVNNSKNLNRKLSTSQLNLKSGVLKVNLYSRKRHSFSSPSNSNASCFGFGIPQLVCNKPHYFQTNDMEKMSENEPINHRERFVFKAKDGFLTNVLSNMNINQNSSPLFKHSKNNNNDVNNLPQNWSSSLSSSVFITPFTQHNNDSMTPTSIFNTSLIDMQHENEPVCNDANESVLSNFPTPSQTPTDFKLAHKGLITTPTSFQMTPSSFFQMKNSSNNGHFDDTDDANLINSLICQSPKVLVSNHHFSNDEYAKSKKNKNENHMQLAQINTGESNQVLFNKNSSTNNLYLPNESSTDCALRVSLMDTCSDSSTKQPETNCSAHMLTSPTNNIQISMFKKCLKQCGDEQIDDYNSFSYEEPLISLSSTNNSDSYINFKNGQHSQSTQHFLLNSKRSLRANHPLSSSPAPLRKAGTLLFDFDNSLRNPKSIKNALKGNLNGNESKTKGHVDNNNNTTFTIACSPTLDNLNNKNTKEENKRKKFLNNISKGVNIQLSYSNSNFNCTQLAPSCLLGSFEESLLNGRINPVGVVDGFYAEIGASGSFFPDHVSLPVYAAFYQVSEDIAASPYLGIINLSSLGKRGYKVPNKGTIQVTLFNPNNSVVKMFVVMYDLSDMPPNHQTFLRQRTMYVPLASSNGEKFDDDDDCSTNLKSYLRYLIHLRFSTTKSGKLYLHSNIKMLFARNKCEIDPRLARYEYKTFTQAPKNPSYSPKK